MTWGLAGLVALGGACGAVARWKASIWLGKVFPVIWPMGTFFVNVLGSFLLGFLSVYYSVDSNLWALFGIGFCGAFTTFSTFNYEIYQLLHTGHWKKGTSYLLLTVITGIAGCWLGIIL